MSPTRLLEVPFHQMFIKVKISYFQTVVSHRLQLWWRQLTLIQVATAHLFEFNVTVKSQSKI